jgi:addiction module RelE/StbE family toxin
LRVEWSDQAVADVVSIHAYLSQFTPTAALDVIDRISRSADRLSLFPLSGRSVPEFGSRAVREVIVTPYRVFYIVRADRIDILAVRHSAQDLPS